MRNSEASCSSCRPLGITDAEKPHAVVPPAATRDGLRSRTILTEAVA
jgi:hypothetical protein